MHLGKSIVTHSKNIRENRSIAEYVCLSKSKINPLKCGSRKYLMRNYLNHALALTKIVRIFFKSNPKFR